MSIDGLVDKENVEYVYMYGKDFLIIPQITFRKLDTPNIEYWIHSMFI